MARKKVKISEPKKDAYAIVVDGETEFWYFQMFKRNESSLQINIEPKIPQKKKLSDLYKKVLEYAEVYTKVFWIIDLDVVIAESKYTKKGTESPTEELNKYLEILKNKKYANVITILNNPCLEFWFVLHFEQTTKYFPKCSEAENQLKKYLTDYTKEQKYFTKQNSDIYLKLKSKLSTAIKNAKKTEKNDNNELEKGICEMNLFFEAQEISKILNYHSKNKKAAKLLLTNI